MPTPIELQALLAAQRTGWPFVIYRDGAGAQRIVVLDDHVERRTIGRAADNDLALAADPSVSRVHAALERIGGAWTLVDGGLSRNGSFVNGERVRGRRRLIHGDAIRLGGTQLRFQIPDEDVLTATATETPAPAPELTPMQRRVLLALARPCRDLRMAQPPATNRQIAAELVLSVDAVKTHLRSLFAKFAVGELPQNRKRHALVAEASTAPRSRPASSTELGRKPRLGQRASTTPGGPHARVGSGGLRVPPGSDLSDGRLVLAAVECEGTKARVVALGAVGLLELAPRDGAPDDDHPTQQRPAPQLAAVTPEQRNLAVLDEGALAGEVVHLRGTELKGGGDQPSVGDLA